MRFAHTIIAAALPALLAFAGAASGGEEQHAAAIPVSGWGAFFSEVFHSVDVVGFVLATLFVVLLGMAIDMFGRIRVSKMIPDALLADVQAEMTNGEYEKALEISEKSDCLIGQVFVSALSKTDYSFERMADAMRVEVRIQGLVARQWVAQFRVTAVAGILLGAAGAAFEAMRFVFGLSGHPNPGLSLSSSFETRALAYAFLFSLLMGAVMALVSLIVSTVASSRLEKILLEAERLGEELLDPFRPLPQTEEE
jgi:hypothetical protein